MGQAGDTAGVRWHEETAGRFADVSEERTDQIPHLGNPHHSVSDVEYVMGMGDGGVIYLGVSTGARCDALRSIALSSLCVCLRACVCMCVRACACSLTPSFKQAVFPALALAALAGVCFPLCEGYFCS